MIADELYHYHYYKTMAPTLFGRIPHGCEVQLLLTRPMGDNTYKLP